MNKLLLNYFNGEELPASVWQNKYAEKGEITPNDMHYRMAVEFHEVEKDYQKHENPRLKSKLSEYGKNRKNLDLPTIFNLFKDFKYVIPQGSVMSQLGSESIGSLSNCFVIGTPEDSYGGIFQKDEEMAHLMKRRGGVGVDISTLRPNGTYVSNAAKSSTGAVSFMHRYSNTTREVAQSGRRGALMISISIDHPDVMDFIKIKRDLTQVTGANISIKLNDEFMKAVENDEDYILRFPCDSKINFDTNKLEYNTLLPLWDCIDKSKTIGHIKKIRAREYWDEIIKSAHNVAEPGLMFEDNHVDFSPDGAYKQYRGVTTNPCGEIFMQPYDACRLIAINLFSFVVNPYTSTAHFDYNKFYTVVYEAMRLSDDLVDLELKYIKRILNKIKNDPETDEVKARELALWEKVYNTASSSRRTGLGITALGDALAALNLKYDSDEALKEIDSIFYAHLEASSDCTIDLAILRGGFKDNDPEMEFGVDMTQPANRWYQSFKLNFPNQAHRMYLYGRRNVSWSTCAPTGTVSLLADNCTGGIEPLFSPYYFRRKKINPNEQGVRVDFVDQNGDSWTEYPVLHPKFKKWIEGSFTWSEDGDLEWLILDKDRLEALFKQSPWYGSTANDIDWVKRVQIQSIIQNYITHSISSTINLPSDVTEESVSKIYLQAWKKGLKGITVYRDGSRSGVLITETENPSTFEFKDAVKRPEILKGDLYSIRYRGEDWLVAVGLLESKPYEIFATRDEWAIPKNSECVIIKKTKGRYDLEYPNVDYTTRTLKDFTSTMANEEAVSTRLISLALRHGTDIKYIVEQIGKTHGDLSSFSKVVSRVLKKYIPEGTKSTVSCQECGSDKVHFHEGCLSCLECGSSKCG